MPYPNWHAARMIQPERFERFTTKGLASGVEVILGFKKGDQKAYTQSYRFAVSKFTEEQAKKWMADNNKKFIDFEPASGVKKVQAGGPGSGRYPAGSGGEGKGPDVIGHIKNSTEYPASALKGGHNFEDDELFMESSQLSDTQKAAIAVYRSNDYMSINSGLRGDVPLDRFDPTTEPEEYATSIGAVVDEMDAAFEGAPTLDEPAVLYRGGNFDKETLSQMTEGSIVEDKAFLSTSDSPNVAGSFAGGNPNMGFVGVQFEIAVPAGERYLMLSSAEEGSESEVLFNRGSSMRVVSRTTQYADGTGDAVVRMELLPRKGGK